MSTLNGKTVLVTGASGGIGAEVARAFAMAGAKLIVHYAGALKDIKVLVMSCQKSFGYGKCDARFVTGETSVCGYG